MWKLLLLSASLLSAQETSMECVNNGALETQSVPGPGGVAAVLKVSAADDYSKNTHDCMAKYQLLVRPTGDGPVIATELLSSNGNWGRKLGAHLDGYSQDGKRVFGIFSEGGRAPSTTLFDYDAATSRVKLVDLKKDLSRLQGLKCGTTFAIAGTTETGAIVLEPNTTDQCQSKYHWTIDPSSGVMQRLAPGKTIVDLYKAP